MSVTRSIRIAYRRSRESLKSKFRRMLEVIREPGDTIHPFKYYAQQLERKLIDKAVSDDALWCIEGYEVIAQALLNTKIEGLYLEFGVNKGGSTRFIAQRLKPGATLHGFDSFEGLPDGDGEWHDFYVKNKLDRKGNPPEVPENVKLHHGWFKQTLPAFLTQNSGPVAFMNVDCDVYSSTHTIFTCLADRIVPGTVIEFDELFNYRGWVFEEYRAFHEYLRLHDADYRILALGASSRSSAPRFGNYGKMAVVITRVGKAAS